MNIPQPGMAKDWKDWAMALVAFFLDVPDKATLQIYGDFADDTAAATGGVPVGGYYRTGSALKVRVS